MPVFLKVILIVFGSLAGVLTALFALTLITVGISVRYNAGGFKSAVIIGGIKIDADKLIELGQNAGQRFKKDAKKPKRKAVKRKPEKKAEAAHETKLGSLSEFEPLIGDFFRFFGSVISKLRFRNLKMNIVVGGASAYDTAINYGKISALVCALFPFEEDILRAKGTDITVNFDFSADQIKLDCALDVSIRLIWILKAAGVLGYQYYDKVMSKKTKRKKAVLK